MLEQGREMPMQDAIRLALTIAGRIAAFIFSLFLSVISLYYKWKISAVIGIGLLATNFLETSIHKRVFRVSRPFVIAVGVTMWFIAALIELKAPTLHQ